MYSFLIALGLLLWSTNFFAQSLNDGLRAFNNRNYVKARSIFEQSVKNDPNNAETHYWLGQAYLKLNEVTKAVDTYEQAFLNKKLSKSALLTVGIGHTLLYKKDSAGARAKFDEALILSRSRKVNVMAAIGYANLTKGGNLDYAIDILTKATTTKRFNDSRVYVSLGYAYKKKLDGSNSVRAFSYAARMNPNEAEAYYQPGKIYATQNNVSVFLRDYRAAIAADPNFSPVYLDMYSYFFTELKVDSAQKYLKLYEQKVEKTSETDALINLFAAEVMFLKKDYEGSIKKLESFGVDQSTKMGKIILSRKSRVLALNYEAKGDAEKAFVHMRKYIEEKKKDEDGVTVGDYYIFGRMLAATKDATRDKYLIPVTKEALSLVNVEDKKLSIIRKMTQFADREKWLKGSAQLKVLTLSTKKESHSNDYFNAGYACFNAKMYKKANELLKEYVTMEPDQPFGYFWLANTNLVLDNTLESSKPYFEKYLEVVGNNVDEENKSGLLKAYTFMGGYYTKNKKFDEAIDWWDKLLNIDPNNKMAHKTKTQLENYLDKMAKYKKRMAEYEKRKKEMNEE